MPSQISVKIYCVQANILENLKEKNTIKIKSKDNNFVKMKIIHWPKINCYWKLKKK